MGTGALEELLVDLEREEAPFGGNAVRLMELDEFVVLEVVRVVVVGGLLVCGAVEVVKANCDLDGAVAANLGLVEVVGVPGDLEADVSEISSSTKGIVEEKAYYSRWSSCTACWMAGDSRGGYSCHPG